MFLDISCAFYPNFPIPLNDLTSTLPVARLAAGFHEIHRESYGYDLPDQAIQSVYLGATAFVAAPVVEVKPYSGRADGSAATVTRRVLVAAGEWSEAIIVKRDELPVGRRLEGPAIIEEPDSTTYVPPGFSAEVHPTWCLVVQPVDGKGGPQVPAYITGFC